MPDIATAQPQSNKLTKQENNVIRKLRTIKESGYGQLTVIVKEGKQYKTHMEIDELEDKGLPQQAGYRT